MKHETRLRRGLMGKKAVNPCMFCGRELRSVYPNYSLVRREHSYRGHKTVGAICVDCLQLMMKGEKLYHLRKTIREAENSVRDAETVLKQVKQEIHNLLEVETR